MNKEQVKDTTEAAHRVSETAQKAAHRVEEKVK